MKKEAKKRNLLKENNLKKLHPLLITLQKRGENTKDLRKKFEKF